MTARTQQPTQRPPTIPFCGLCGKQRVLYGGLCSGCLAKDEEEES
jgi:hypothetical protein